MRAVAESVCPSSIILSFPDVVFFYKGLEVYVCEWNFYAVYDVGYNTRMVIAESFCRICTLINYLLLFLSFS